MERKSGTEQRLIFRTPGRPMSSVPDVEVSQKDHFAESFLNDLDSLVLTKEKILSMFLMFLGGMWQRDPI